MQVSRAAMVATAKTMNAKHKQPSEDERKQAVSDQIMALAPSNDLMVAAWLGCVHWAAGDASIVGHFREATGCKWVPPRSPIEQMVDEATGADAAFLLAFIRYVNQWHWGEIDGRACNGDELETESVLENL